MGRTESEMADRIAELRTEVLRLEAEVARWRDTLDETLTNAEKAAAIAAAALAAERQWVLAEVWRKVFDTTVRGGMIAEYCALKREARAAHEGQARKGE